MRQQIHATGDGVLAQLLEELRAYPVPQGGSDTQLEGEHLTVVLGQGGTIVPGISSEGEQTIHFSGDGTAALTIVFPTDPADESLVIAKARTQGIDASVLAAARSHRG